MKISGLLCCKKCGVYETESRISYQNGRSSILKIYYWSNLPKRGLQLENCPNCNPLNQYDQVYDYYG